MNSAYSVIEVISMGKASSLKLGKEKYGSLKIEKVFLKALESYFKKA